MSNSAIEAYLIQTMVVDDGTCSALWDWIFFLGLNVKLIAQDKVVHIVHESYNTSCMKKIYIQFYFIAQSVKRVYSVKIYIAYAKNALFFF